jgi:hypothetical protein
MRGSAEWTDGVLLAGRDCVSVERSPGVTATTVNPADAVRSICTITADATGKELPQAAVVGSRGAQCGWASTCTTAFANKSVLDAYAASSTIPTFATTASEGTRLLLDGQPLVIGGSTFMRQYTPIGTQRAYFDFPTLVGNTFNEFTIESYNAVGVPATLVLPNTPSKQVTASSLS